MKLSPKEQEYILAFLQDKEFELAGFKQMDAFLSDIKEMYQQWFVWYLEQPYENKQRYMVSFPLNEFNYEELKDNYYPKSKK